MDGKSALSKHQAEEAARVRSYASKVGMKTPDKYAAGGAVKDKKGSTTINISVGKDSAAPNPMAAAALAGALKPKAPPVVLPPQAPPMPPQGGPPGLAGIAGGMMPGMKRGGRATALPMTAGAMSGPGREQKADSEARKEGKHEPAETRKRKA